MIYLVIADKIQCKCGEKLAKIYDRWLSFATDSGLKDSNQARADQLGIGKSALMRLLLERGLEHFSEDPDFIFKDAKISK